MSAVYRYIYTEVRENYAKNTTLSTAIPVSYINSHSQHAGCCAQVCTLGILRSKKCQNNNSYIIFIFVPLLFFR